VSETLELKVRELRRAFDASFAQPAQTAAVDVENLLLISVSGDRYALKLREVSAIAQRPVIVEVPSQAPGLLGIAGIRGNIVPVFRLATLLGYSISGDTLSWVIVCGSDDAMAFAFDGFDGYVCAERSLLMASELQQRCYVEEFFAAPSGPRPVVALTQIVAAVRRRSESGSESGGESASGQGKEREET
jgi:purine-binding chemotaxis protein CheW